MYLKSIPSTVERDTLQEPTFQVELFCRGELFLVEVFNLRFHIIFLANNLLAHPF